MHPLLSQLGSLYARIEAPPGPNRCGSCNLCCTARGLSHQRVTELEFAYLEHHYGPQGSFRRYVTRQEMDLFPTCPHLGSEGCQVYEHRPFSCRVFGHYRLEGTRLPEECVYTGSEKVLPRQRYYQEIPGARDLRALSRDFSLLRGSAAATEPSSAPDSAVGLDLDDPWDIVLEAITQGQFPPLPAAQAEEPLFATYVRALWTSAQNLHPQALSHYLRLTEICPQRSDFQTFAGFHAFQLGQLEMAEALWLESLQLDPRQPMAFAFLGYLATHRQDWQSAADFFGAAAQLEPDQPLHRERRQQALSHLE